MVIRIRLRSERQSDEFQAPPSLERRATLEELKRLAADISSAAAEMERQDEEPDRRVH